MLSFHFNLFSGMTLIMFAAQCFGFANFNFLAILTPALLGEGAFQILSYWAWRKEQKEKAEAAEKMKAFFGPLSGRVPTGEERKPFRLVKGNKDDASS